MSAQQSLKEVPHEAEGFKLLKGSLQTSKRAEIPYWPVEISQFSFAAITDSKIQKGDFLNFVGSTHEIKVEVQEVVSSYKGTPFDLVRLVTKDLDKNLEDQLRTVPELKRWNPQNLNNEPIRLPFADLHVRSARFSTNSSLRIHARTFGTRGDFVLYTENVSKSGLLIKEDSNPAPFTLNTIIELTIDPETKVFPEPVHCLGKIVRREGEQSIGSRYGIQLIDMKEDTLEGWSQFVEDLERKIAVSR